MTSETDRHASPPAAAAEAHGTRVMIAGSEGAERCIRSRRHPTNDAKSLKLLKESRIVFEEQADVRDPVAQHGDAFDPHAEGEAGEPLAV